MADVAAAAAEEKMNVDKTEMETKTSTVETAPTSKDDETLKKAVNQVEFYFADSNLPYDKFMWMLYTKDPEHWVPVQTIASFKRMREFSAHGLDWLVHGLRSLSSALEVDAAGEKLRRRTEVQEPKGQFERSVYAKGFPDEEPTLQKRLEAFFEQYGTTNAVRMRRDETKKFKGSVFAEFADYSTVERFLNADPKPSFEGGELLIMSKEAYCDMKIKEKGLKGKAANNRRDLISRGRGFNAFREMAREKEAAGKGKGKKIDDAGDEAKKDVYLEFMGSKILIHRDEEGNGVVKEEDVPYVKGATLKFEGCGGDVRWTDIKDPIKEHFDGRAPFIKYARGDDSGLVGFHKALSDEDIAFVKEHIQTLNSHEVAWTLPEESEEKQFQVERAQTAAKSALSSANGGDRRGGSGSGGGGGGGRGGGRGHGRGRGRGRGRGGGRGGGRSNGRDAAASKPDAAEAASEESAQAGEKRKRVVEPDGGPDVGVRGNNAPPMLQKAASKKAKTEGEDSAAS